MPPGGGGGSGSVYASVPPGDWVSGGDVYTSVHGAPGVCGIGPSIFETVYVRPTSVLHVSRTWVPLTRSTATKCSHDAGSSGFVPSATSWPSLTESPSVSAFVGFVPSVTSCPSSSPSPSVSGFVG